MTAVAQQILRARTVASMGVESDLTVQQIVNEVFAQLGFAGATSNLTVAGNLSVAGTVTASALPTADPHVAGEIWSNSGVLTVSAG